MARGATVKVSNRFQIAVPSAVRERLKIRRGDRLLVDIQDGMVILIPEPSSHTAALAGLHREIWERLDGDRFLERERSGWDESRSD